MNIEENFLSIYDKAIVNIPKFIKENEELYDEICEKYNGLYNLCKSLGLKYPCVKKRSKEEIIKELYRLNKKFGYVSKPMMEKYSYINQKVIQREFGSFANMYEELNIKRHPSGRVPTDEQLIAELQRIYDTYGTINDNIILQESEYSTTCFICRFGSINAIKKMFSIETTFPKSFTSAIYVFKKYQKYLNEEYIPEKTFDWLKNSNTKQPLRIDAYFPEHNLAIEYNGPQHYEIGSLYITNQEELEHRQHLDKLKLTLLAAHNIPTIVVHYKDKVNQEYIENSLRNIGLLS